MISIYCGIDPGMTGALAILIQDDVEVASEVWDFEEAIDGIGRLTFLSSVHPTKALIEKQQAFKGQGISSTFKLGENFGWWQGMLQGIEVPYEFVTPAKWKREIFDGGAISDNKKGMSLDLARRLFPERKDDLKRKKDHGRAEALLIAEVLRRRGR